MKQLCDRCPRVSRDGHRRGTTTSKSSESFDPKSAAELLGRTHPRSVADRLEGIDLSLPGPSQLSFCFQREGCLRLRYFVHLTATVTQSREKCKDTSKPQSAGKLFREDSQSWVCTQLPKEKICVIKKLQIICKAYI